MSDPDDLAEHDAGDDIEPRCPHYTFAHVALRSVAFRHPAGCLGVLASPDAHAFLADLLRSVDEHCREMGRPGQLAVDDLNVHRGRCGDYPCAVVEMPRPRGITEAFFVALVLLVDMSADEPDFDHAALRYFTLEKGAMLGGPPRTVLCEWTADGSHVNYGDGPPAELGAFVDKVAEMVSR